MLEEYLNKGSMTNDNEAPPTRSERLGHQPRQAAGDLGPGEVVVVEALDGGDDEGPSHPPEDDVLRRISHLLRRRISREQLPPTLPVCMY